MPEHTTAFQPVQGRFRSLDGLRGVASLIVVFHHLVLVVPDFATSTVPPSIGSLRWWFEATPLKLLTAGDEAVLVFFVLSGMVVALPVLRRRDFDWLDYYPRRILRLGLPVAAALVLAAVLIVVHPQVLGTRMDAWVAAYSFAHPAPTLFVSSFDLFVPTNLIDNPLWSIRLEVLFSLALPVFVLVAVLVRRRCVVAVVVALVLVEIGTQFGNPSLQYFPVFFVGTLLAVHQDALLAWSARVGRSAVANWAGFAVLLGGCALLVAHWLLLGVGFLPRAMQQGALGAEFLGALVIVAVCFLWNGAGRALSTVVPRWLGRVSFSLYLVHVPILLFWVNVFGAGTQHWWMIVACTVPMSLVVAELFGRFVEQPSHRFSQRVGAALSARLRVGQFPGDESASPSAAPAVPVRHADARVDHRVSTSD